LARVAASSSEDSIGNSYYDFGQSSSHAPETYNLPENKGLKEGINIFPNKYRTKQF